MDPETSAVLHRSLQHKFLRLSRGEKSRLFFEDGSTVIDASGGAAVACIGHGNEKVKKAIAAQLDKIAYCSTAFYTSRACEDLCQELVSSTHGFMTRALIVSSGSEAMEAAMKLARQYFLEKSTPEPKRINFIARSQSYHGTTLGSLSMGGHVYRRAKFEPMLLTNISRVSPCFPYRNRAAQENDEAYVARLAAELDAEFQRLGPETVCAFVAEPVVGAALGCVPSVPGYFKAMRQVCDKHGALLILDEVMCGMGRTGTLHAWEQEDVVPDIQTLGKCLGGGYQPIAAVLVNRSIVDVMSSGTGAFVHGHTYQGHPIACAAALEVQKIVKEENLLENVRSLEPVLSQGLLDSLSQHPNVGNIRGRGFFWGIEFVANKETGEPFPVSAGIAMGLAELGLSEAYGIAVYPGAGTVDGVNGDHVIVSPAYNTTAEEIEFIVDAIKRLVFDYFKARES
ncbi:pyridoxal phosphate-dependent transferase [Pestalotiopsis sp. NC0098]|nr:pyridoxal phosphate-dependent transferase [Pestalotiopsis sp. NC0098]